jgi:hypothetical protein
LGIDIGPLPWAVVQMFGHPDAPENMTDLGRNVWSDSQRRRRTTVASQPGHFLDILFDNSFANYSRAR